MRRCQSKQPEFVRLPYPFRQLHTLRTSDGQGGFASDYGIVTWSSYVNLAMLQVKQTSAAEGRYKLQEGDFAGPKIADAPQ
jgi:hypothetical protein